MPSPNPATERDPENLKLAVCGPKAPLGIVPMAALVGAARVLEDGGAVYSPGNFMAQSAVEAVASYDSAQLRHRMRCQPLGGIVSPESYTARDEDSGLPHVDHMIAGLLILRALLIRDGYLPVDPGVGRRKAAKMQPPAAPQMLRAVMRTDPLEPEPCAFAYARRCDECPYGDGMCNGCDHPAREQLVAQAEAAVATQRDANEAERIRWQEVQASAALASDQYADAERFRAIEENLRRLKADAQMTENKAKRDADMAERARRRSEGL